MLHKVAFYGRLIGWKISSPWAKLFLKSSGVEFGPGLRLRTAPFVVKLKNSTIVLGERVSISNGLAENPAGVFHRTVLAAARPGATLRIGDDVGISGAVLYAEQSIEIGDRCLIGAGATIYDTDFHALAPAERHVRFSPQVGTAPVKLGNDVWIGAEAMILKGVVIGDNAIVGARALVTKDVPAGAIAGGVPAKVVSWVPGFGPAESGAQTSK